MPGTDGALALGDDARADRGRPASTAITSSVTRSASTRSRPAQRNGRPSARRAHAASRPRRSWRWRATTARRKPAAIRVNYGMQRVAGGGNAVRAIACLPALVGAWRDPAGGALLSSSGTYPVDHHALERPDLIAGHPRTINMSAIGDALLDARDPPIRAIYVYNSNPVAVAPESGRVRAGFAREDLFCVVHEIFQTDTADFADILLPATTQLEQIDVHTSYGHLYALANNKAIEPLGEALPNTEVFRRLASRMGFTEPCFRDTDEDIARMAFRRDDPRARDLDWETLKSAGWQRLTVDSEYAPFAQGGFPTPSGKCEFASGPRGAGLDPLPTSSRRASPQRLTRRWRSAFRSPSSRRPRETSSILPLRTCRRSCARKARRGSTSIPHDAARARHRRRRPRPHLQRSRQLHRHRARRRACAGRRGGGALDLVAEALARRPQRERRDFAGADRSRACRDVLRLSGRGRA